MTDELIVSDEFLDDSKNNLGQFMPKSRSTGPHSAAEKLARRNEISRYHFDYGYSARKIADILKINRNTVNSDIQFLYSQSARNWVSYEPEKWVQIHTSRLELQRTRLREMLDSAEKIQEKVVIERMLLDLESRIINIHLKLTESIQKVYNKTISQLNSIMKKEGKDNRYLTFWDTLSVSPKGHEKIQKILKDERVK